MALGLPEVCGSIFWTVPFPPERPGCSSLTPASGAPFTRSAIGTIHELVNTEERACRACPYRSLLDAGVHLSYGSDMSGEAAFDPLLSIHYTVNRSGPERIGPREALEAYTLGSAKA